VTDTLHQTLHQTIHITMSLLPLLLGLMAIPAAYLFGAHRDRR